MSAAAGCGGNELESPTAARLRGLATLYLEYTVSKNGQGPASEPEFKKFLRGRPGFALQMNGLNPGALDAAFVSERDGEPFVLLYGLSIRQISGHSAPLVAHEKTGKKDSTAGPGLGGANPGCWNWWNDATGDNLNHPFYHNTLFVRGGKGGVPFPPDKIAGARDGLSNTIMLAEKFVDPTRYQPVPTPEDPEQHTWGRLGFTDNGYWQGWGWATLRCSMGGPVWDQHYTTIAYWQMFGSAHPSGINAVFGDGSVQLVGFTVPNPIFQLLCRKNDGLVVDLSGF